MQAALDLVLPYTHVRKQFGIPIAHNQLIQGKLADMYTKLAASRAYTYATAREVDNAAVSPSEWPSALKTALARSCMPLSAPLNARSMPSS